MLRSPDTVATTYGPAVAEADPQFGPEAALSAFDANFATSLYFQKNDQEVNDLWAYLKQFGPHGEKK